MTGDTADFVAWCDANNTNDTVDPIDTWKNTLPWLSDYSEANHYAALFTKVPSGWEALGLLAYHACELSYVHGYPESLIAHYQLDDIVTLKGNFCFERCSDGVTVKIGEKTFSKVTGESIVDLFEKEVFPAIYGGK